MLKPRSIQQLTVTGFLAVTGVLLVALYITARQIDALGGRGEQVLSQSAAATAAARILIEQSTALERNARQYQYTNDRTLLNVYRERQQSFTGAADQLLSLTLSEGINDEVAALKQDEANYFQKVLIGSSNELIQSSYQSLRERALRLTDLLGEWTTGQLNAIRKQTADTQQSLRMQGGVLTIVALALVAIFTTLITRPLVQLERAINLLGDGSYDKQVAVEGPADLRHLGNSLDWLRSRLQKLEQQRSAFFRHVSHELKTPLASIQESVALLRDGVAGPVNAEQLQLLAINNSNCQRLQGLIDELLRYHREIQSLLNAVPTNVQLDDVVLAVVESHRFALQQAGVTVDTRLESVKVKGDKEQLRVIIDNLLTNALKFSPDKATIWLRVRREEERVLLEVEDQGPGIPEEQRELVFQAFYQGAAPLRSTIKSSGLGLAIVQEYVSANRGMIEVVPCATGALFRVVLPQSGE